MFRETDFHYLLSDLSQSPANASALDWQAAGYFVSLVCLYAAPLAVHYALDRRDGTPVAAVQAHGALALRTFASTAMFFAILVLRTANSGDFIYFKF